MRIFDADSHRGAGGTLRNGGGVSETGSAGVTEERIFEIGRQPAPVLAAVRLERRAVAEPGKVDELI